MSEEIPFRDLTLIIGSCLFLGFVFGVTMIMLSNSNKITLNQETANEICYNFTQVDGIIALEEQGKLICEVPSFDSTQNIIIKGNEE